MPIQPVNIGTGPDTGDGDNIRDAFNKVNSSLNYLDSNKAEVAPHYAHSSDAKYPALGGAIDDVNDIFTLPHVPVAGTILVHHNQVLTTDFTEHNLPNKQIKLGFIPRTTGPVADTIMVSYAKA